MATSHYRLDPKELRQPDEFVTLADRTWEYVNNHLGRVIVVAVALIAIASVAFGVGFYYQHRERVESASFYAALTALDQKKYNDAAAGFSALSQTGAGRLAQLAQLYLATAYLDANQPAKARDALAAYLAAGSQPLFKEMALMQLGVVNENLGDFKAAHQAYSDAAALNGPESHTAQIEAARTLARLGDTAGAIAAYRQFLAANPFSEERTDVIEALAQLGAAPAATTPGTSAPGPAKLPAGVAIPPAAAGNPATAAASASQASPTR
ncbi:MAG: tetratricopeptide repeat protein [Candidatus Binataceae bacterium]|nr:tetratricopeptide repeat protein [Candidatus Binataceae bacterium]